MVGAIFNVGQRVRAVGGQVMNILHYLHLFYIRQGNSAWWLLVDFLVVAITLALCWPLAQWLAQYCRCF